MPNTQSQNKPQNQNIGNQEHLKKDGTVDHRYKGQREGAEDDQIQNPDYTRAESGGQTEDGTHVTKDGKPDRRFQENRAMSEEEAKIAQAENIIKETQGGSVSRNSGNNNRR